MELSSGFRGREQQIIQLFTDTFADSEGPGEGELIGALVRNMFSGTAPDDIWVYTASNGAQPVGAAVFTRVRYASDPRTVFILSPMAVAPAHQRQGIGQALITHALQDLCDQGCDMALTYGDPDYYGRVGFIPVSEDVAPAPMPLSFPHGWLAHPLAGKELTPLSGPAACVEALNDPHYW